MKKSNEVNLIPECMIRWGYPTVPCIGRLVKIPDQKMRENIEGGAFK